MDSCWTDTIRKQLKTMPASKFVAVNESVCLIDRNSRVSDVLRVAMRYPLGRWVLFGLWLWFGWHLFVRGWRFFLRA